MALETWLIKFKTVISSHKFDSSSAILPSSKTFRKSSRVGVLAFEISGHMTKLLHLWHLLSDTNMTRLRNDYICLEGIRKIVSDDDVFLLSLACAEISENLKSIADSTSRLSTCCQGSDLRSFDRVFEQFAETGKDANNWVLSWKDVESKIKKMERYVDSTATLRKEIDKLVQLEAGLRKAVKLCHLHDLRSSGSKEEQSKVAELQQMISYQKQQVRHQKERSLWNRSFDSVTLVLARSIFTVLARIKMVFGIGHGQHPTTLPRCLSASAAVHPSVSTNIPKSSSIARQDSSLLSKKCQSAGCNFFELNSKLLRPPSSTLGSAALALHYANLIIVTEKMIRSPHLVSVDARDDLYAMLSQSIRSSLRSRLRGIGFAASDDPVLARDWKDALGRILGWLSPLAHNMIKWQSERNFEQQNQAQEKTNVLLFQTLHFANKEKTEAAITELLVGLNYVWRFEREMMMMTTMMMEKKNANDGVLS